MDEETQVINSVIHAADRLILCVGLQPGVTLNVSLTDNDLERFAEARREHRQRQALKLLTTGE